MATTRRGVWAILFLVIAAARVRGDVLGNSSLEAQTNATSLRVPQRKGAYNEVVINSKNKHLGGGGGGGGGGGI